MMYTPIHIFSSIIVIILIIVLFYLFGASLKQCMLASFLVFIGFYITYNHTLFTENAVLKHAVNPNAVPYADDDVYIIQPSVFSQNLPKPVATNSKSMSKRVLQNSANNPPVNNSSRKTSLIVGPAGITSNGQASLQQKTIFDTGVLGPSFVYSRKQ